MQNMKEKIEIFKKEICRNCKNNNCNTGIVTTTYEQNLQIKCCDYMPKEKTENQEIEITRYYYNKKRGIET